MTTPPRHAPGDAHRGGEIRTRRWNDPARRDDGLRILVCRYRPRGLRTGLETWDEWWQDLAPSRALHADYYGKHGPPIDLAEFQRRFRAEMAAPAAQRQLRAIADRVAAGGTVTLLCSSACTDDARCHRSILRALVQALPVR